MATSSLAWQNKYTTALSSSITASDTTIPLDVLPTGNEGFLVIEPDSDSYEVIYFTSKTGSEVVCPSAGAGRGQDGSSASSHSQGAVVKMVTVAAMFEALQDGSAMPVGALESNQVTASGCGLTHSTTQSIANATGQAVVFDTESFDTDTYHSTSSNTSRITAPTNGKYSFHANISFAINSTGVRYIYFVKNGVTTDRYGANNKTAVSGDLTQLSTSYVFTLTATDYVEVYAYQSSGGSLNLNGDATNAGLTSFECIRVGS
jgi:hypothetical protein